MKDPNFRTYYRQQFQNILRPAGSNQVTLPAKSLYFPQPTFYPSEMNFLH